MASGAFITGVDVVDQEKLKVPQSEQKPKIPDRIVIPPVRSSSVPRLNQLATDQKKPQTAIVERLPRLSVDKPKTILRNHSTDSNFNKPIFKKMDQVTQFYETKASQFDVEDKKSKESNGKLAGKRDLSAPKRFTFADAFEMVISKYTTQDLDDIYRNKKSFKDIEALKNTQKKPHFIQELEKEHSRLARDKKRYNDLVFQIKEKQKILEHLQRKDNELVLLIPDNTNLESDLEKREQEIQEIQEKLTWDEHTCEMLTQMRMNKKDHLTYWESKVRILKQIITERNKVQGIESKSLEALQEMLKKDKSKARRLSWMIQHRDEQLDPEFEEVFEDEVSEFEERRRLREIIRHEQILDDEEDQRKDDMLRATKQKKEEALHKEQEIEHRKLKKDRDALARRRRQFEEFQKVTRASEVGDLIPRLDYLEESIKKMEESIEEKEKYNEDKKKELEDLLLQLQKGKFEIDTSDPNDKKLEQLEKESVQKKNKVNGLEGEVKRVNKLINESCVSISRVLHQLHKGKYNKPVEKETISEVLSLCGLKLERMLTVVVKKHKTFFMESINTDATLKEDSENYPPPYMGLVYKDLTHKRPDDEILEEESGEDENFMRTLRNSVKLEQEKLGFTDKKPEQIVSQF